MEPVLTPDTDKQAFALSEKVQLTLLQAVCNSHNITPQDIKDYLVVPDNKTKLQTLLKTAAIQSINLIETRKDIFSNQSLNSMQVCSNHPRHERVWMDDTTIPEIQYKFDTTATHHKPEGSFNVKIDEHGKAVTELRKVEYIPHKYSGTNTVKSDTAIHYLIDMPDPKLSTTTKYQITVVNQDGN